MLGKLLKNLKIIKQVLKFLKITKAKVECIIF
jgi:hypothetical protein